MGRLDHWLYSVMDLGERFIRRLLDFGVMIATFVVSIVFGESYRGLGCLGGSGTVTYNRAAAKTGIGVPTQHLP